MPSTARTALVILAVLGGLLAGGFGVRELLRSPIDDLVVRTSPPQPTEAAVQHVQPRKPPRPSEDYAGSAACVQCHADVCEHYREHPMGRSLASVTGAPQLEDYGEKASFDAPPLSHSKLTWHYSVERSANGVRHHEVARDSQGEVVYDQAEPVHFAVGSGQRGRSYITNHDGLLFMSPITWYSEKGRWNLSPGYLSSNLRFERRIVDGCVACHAGQMASIPNQPDRFESQPFREESIGCERCHGPARGHVEYRLKGSDDDASDPIIRLADLPPRQRESVCFQCHLVGETRITRYGRSEFDFRPGDDLSDIWTTFVLGTGISSDSTTTAVSQPEQMLSSNCYRKSDGKFGCTSCHDPHFVPKPEDRVEHYRVRCLKCHDSGGTPCAVPQPERNAAAGDSCIACHMPKIEAHNVPHTSQTDHRVLRDPGARGQSPATEEQPVLKVYDEESGAVPQADLERARGIMLVMKAERINERLLAYNAIPKLRTWVEAAPDDVPAAEALGMAYWMNHEMESARRTWEAALAAHPDNENLLRRLVMLYHETGKIDQGLEYAHKLVAVNPWQHEYFGRLAHMLGQREKLDEAIEAAQRAVAINPTVADLHGWLAEVYSLKGDMDASRRHREICDKLSPRK